MISGRVTFTWDIRSKLFNKHEPTTQSYFSLTVHEGQATSATIEDESPDVTTITFTLTANSALLAYLSRSYAALTPSLLRSFSTHRQFIGFCPRGVYVTSPSLPRQSGAVSEYIIQSFSQVHSPFLTPHLNSFFATCTPCNHSVRSSISFGWPFILPRHCHELTVPPTLWHNTKRSAQDEFSRQSHQNKSRRAVLCSPWLFGSMTSSSLSGSWLWRLRPSCEIRLAKRMAECSVGSVSEHHRL